MNNQQSIYQMILAHQNNNPVTCNYWNIMAKVGDQKSSGCIIITEWSIWLICKMEGRKTSGYWTVRHGSELVQPAPTSEFYTMFYKYAYDYFWNVQILKTFWKMTPRKGKSYYFYSSLKSLSDYPFEKNSGNLYGKLFLWCLQVTT